MELDKNSFKPPDHALRQYFVENYNVKKTNVFQSKEEKMFRKHVISAYKNVFTTMSRTKHLIEDKCYPSSQACTPPLSLIVQTWKHTHQLGTESNQPMVKNGTNDEGYIK
uniref:Uncharacterized protein n=1 Tax=Oryza brachyantha TaxID=4533 RepID=J3MVH1_ORYBR